jgi:predicted Zn-dependent protease
MYGFSREHEREADVIGYQRLVAAGYAPRESIRTFEHLQAEIKAADIKEPFFFASHPKLQERIDSFGELVKDANSGETGRERFVETTAALRLASLEADLAAYRYKQIILVLGDPGHRREYPPEASYYLGEAYRLRGEPGDPERAEREYSSVIETAPRFAPAHRALGLLCYRRSDSVRAAALLRRYLELAPDAVDRGHIEFYLGTLEKRDAAPPSQPPPATR